MDAKLTVLYLDDSDVQLDSAAQVLAVQGHEVRTATTLRAAIGQMNGVDLVMIDYHMPEVDGAAALEALRKTVRRDTPVAFYLYTADREIAMSYRALGFDGAFIEKGDTSQLPAQVEAANRILNLRRFRHRRTNP